MERRACALVLAGALGAGAVAGCTSGDDDPTPTPTPTVSSTSASPTPTPSPSPTETSTIPAAAREKSEKGAVAFTAHFFEELNRSWMGPRKGLISTLSDPDCGFCNTSEANAEYLVDKGQRYSAPPTTLRDVQAFAGAPAGQQFIEIDLRQNAVDVLNSKGQIVRTDAQKQSRLYVVLIWSQPRGWAVSAVERKN